MGSAIMGWVGWEEEPAKASMLSTLYQGDN